MDRERGCERSLDRNRVHEGSGNNVKEAADHGRGGEETVDHV